MSRLEGAVWQGTYAESLVNAITWAGGYVCSRPELDSGHKMDFQISGAGADSTTRDPRLEVQVKSTFQRRNAEGCSHFDFDVELYDWARKPQDILYVPRIVVVVQVPADAEEWLSADHDALTAKHCAYWISIRGEPQLPVGQLSKSVVFPRSQVFAVTSLVALMDGISGGNWP